MDKELKEILQKFQNRLANLWGCAPICPVKAYEFMEIAIKDILNTRSSETKLKEELEDKIVRKDEAIGCASAKIQSLEAENKSLKDRVEELEKALNSAVEILETLATTEDDKATIAPMKQALNKQNRTDE